MSFLGHAAEPALRLSIFLGMLIATGTWEAVLPRRRRRVSRRVRWPSNLGIAALNTLVLRVAFPLAAVGLALAGEARGWGLLNITHPPRWVAIVVALLTLDLAIYLQHIMFHAVPALWRVNRMHHADLDFDVTTGVRFHPIEMLLSMAIKLAVVAALGAPAAAVLAFELILNATSMFNHGNA